MTPWVVGLLVVLVLAGVVTYLRGLAGRLHTLHIRLETAQQALDAQLARRAGTAMEAGTSGLLDPASSLLLTAAAHTAHAVQTSHATLGAGDPGAVADREEAESALSQALRATFDDDAVPLLRGEPAGAALVAEVASACDRVAIARRFHNDAVAATRRLRRHRAVRYLRLAGSAPWPVTVEMDDVAPPALRVR